jgi:hypothetical protein
VYNETMVKEVKPEDVRMGIRLSYRTASHLRYLSAFAGLSHGGLVELLVDHLWQEIDREAEHTRGAWQDVVSRKLTQRARLVS